MYLLGSDRSADNFLVLANCSIGGGGLLPGTDCMESGSANETPVALDIHVVLGLLLSHFAPSGTSVVNQRTPN